MVCDCCRKPEFPVNAGFILAGPESEYIQSFEGLCVSRRELGEKFDIKGENAGKTV